MVKNVKNKFLLGAAVFAMSFFATSCSDSERPETKTTPDETDMSTLTAKQSVFFVCGSKELMGTESDFEIATENIMSTIPGAEGLHLIKEPVELEPTSYLCLVNQDGDEDKTDTCHLEIEEYGSYQVSFTFIEGEKTLTAIAKKTEEPEPEPVVINIPSMGYATFSAGFNAEVPQSVTVCVATLVGEYMVLNQQECNVIPAGTGVILKGAEGEYTFNPTAEEPSELGENELLPTTTITGELAKYDPNAMVLAMDDDKPIFKRFTKGVEDGFTPNRAYFILEETSSVNSLSIKLQ